jgi:hypothetical protein
MAVRGLNIPVDLGAGLTAAITYQKVREYRWYKGDCGLYYYCTGELLGTIDHIFDCDCVDISCCNSDHLIDIEIYYNKIVHCLSAAAKKYIPKVPRSALKHYWSVALDELKVESKESFDFWVAAGKPKKWDGISKYEYC